MKNRITKLSIIFSSLLLTEVGFSQSTTASNNFSAGSFLGWNATSGNNDLRINTANLNRILIRQNGPGAQLQNYPGSLLNPLPGFQHTRVGISRDGLNPVTLPQSLLHLGYNSIFGFSGGRRSWQDIGTMYSAETDNMYVGLRQKSPADPTGRTSQVTINPTDRQDAVVTWGDNYSGNGPLPNDNLAFIFHSNLPGGFPNPNPNIFAQSDYGREIMRMNGEGNVGIGPVFFDNAQPQNILHINSNATIPTFMQISSQLGTGQTATDGMLLGLDPTMNANLTHQENRNLFLGTNNGERIRVTQVGAPGTPVTAPVNTTRVAISHNPVSPVNLPLALLHLGYNNSFPGNVGWRSWMDIGTFSSRGLDHAYFGLMPTPNGNDAVAAWGWGYNGATGGPDRFRIIFTSNLTPPPAIPGAMGLQDGLEFIRCTPFHNPTINRNDPRTGFGDFNNLSPVGTIDPNNTIEINTPLGNPATGGFGATLNGASLAGGWPASTGLSGLRFRDLTSASTPVAVGTGSINPAKVLSVDGNGDVVLINASGAANNGLSIVNGTVQLGATCGSPSVGLAALTNNRAVPLSGFNFVFSGATGSVGIGTGCIPLNKLEVNNNTGINNTLSGLRLTDVSGNPVPLPYNGKVLSVNTAGDVIVTTAPAGGAVAANNGLQVSSGVVQLGGDCSVNAEVIAGQLLTDRDVSLVNVVNPFPPANQHNLWFSGIPSIAAGGPGGRVGIGVKTSSCVMPGNRLEIFNTGSTGGTVSGLRLTDLAGPALIPMTNPGTGVLSVDANGDVIYVTGGGGGSALGNYCTPGPVNPITGSYQIELASNDFNFTTPSNTAGRVNIGNFACSLPPARLNVIDDNFGTGIFADAFTPGTDNIGVRGSALTIQPLQRNVGVLGESMVFSNNAGAGVAGFSGAASVGAIPFVGGIGVYGNATLNNTAWAGYFDGDVNINGAGGSGGGGTYALTITGAAWNSANLWTGSDRRYKQNIKPLESAIEKIKKLSGYTYNFRTTEFKDNNFPETEQIGLIAQELKEVFPQLVNEDKKGYLAVNYQGMVPVLIEGLKEQQKQIDELKALVQSLTSSTSDIKQSNSQAVDLSDKNTIVLNQNVPNPFAESTTISYNIPTDFNKAQIIFSTSEGKVIRTVDVTVKGPGRLNVFANDLSSGMYTYTLVVDGKTIDTKKMVKN